MQFAMLTQLTMTTVRCNAKSDVRWLHKDPIGMSPVHGYVATALWSHTYTPSDVTLAHHCQDQQQALIPECVPNTPNRCFHFE